MSNGMIESGGDVEETVDHRRPERVADQRCNLRSRLLIRYMFPNLNCVNFMNCVVGRFALLSLYLPL